MKMSVHICILKCVKIWLNGIGEYSSRRVLPNIVITLQRRLTFLLFSTYLDVPRCNP